MLLFSGVPDATNERLSVFNCCPALVTDKLVIPTVPTRSSGFVEGRSAIICPLMLKVSVIRFKALAFNVSIKRSSLSGG